MLGEKKGISLLMKTQGTQVYFLIIIYHDHIYSNNITYVQVSLIKYKKKCSQNIVKSTL